jgi:hypothetical protein
MRLQLTFVSVLTLFAANATAQWSSSAASNQSIGDGPGDQVQPKLAPTSDGGCYVSWYDQDASGSPAFGYDVRLQRLDAHGNEQWPHRGVLVADRGFSSTQDYGLDVDLFGNAVLAFRDDRFVGTQVTMAVVDTAGVLVWGSNGVQVSNTTAFVAVPRVCGTTDGHHIAAWAENNELHLQKLDLAGLPQWPSDVVLTAAGSNLAPSCLQASDNGSFIVSMVKSGSFTSPRHLWAQKFDAAGAPLWGAQPLPVFDGGSLQIGNFPTFVPDGSGGAVFGWYSNSPALECRAQHVDATGVEQFPHNGSAAATGANDRVNPSVAFSPASASTFLVYTEISGGQDRVAAQSFDALGNLQWGPLGVGVTNYSALDTASTLALVVEDRLMAFWTEAPGFAQDQVMAARLDAFGAVTVAPFVVSSTPASKFRVNVARSTVGFPILAWNDDASGSADVLVQNVVPSGSLGGLATAATRNGAGSNPVCLSALAPPYIGQSWAAEVTHLPTAVFSALLMDVAAIGGTVVPGIGEVLVPLPALYATFMPGGVPAQTHTLPIPANLNLIGMTFTSQAVVFYPTSVQACNALDLMIGL